MKEQSALGLFARPAIFIIIRKQNSKLILIKDLINSLIPAIKHMFVKKESKYICELLFSTGCYQSSQMARGFSSDVVYTSVTNVIYTKVNLVLS